MEHFVRNAKALPVIAPLALCFGVAICVVVSWTLGVSLTASVVVVWMAFGGFLGVRESSGSRVQSAATGILCACFAATTFMWLAGMLPIPSVVLYAASFVVAAFSAHVFADMSNVRKSS